MKIKIENIDAEKFGREYYEAEESKGVIFISVKDTEKGCGVESGIVGEMNPYEILCALNSILNNEKVKMIFEGAKEVLEFADHVKESGGSLGDDINPGMLNEMLESSIMLHQLFSMMSGSVSQGEVEDNIDESDIREMSSILARAFSSCSSDIIH